MMKKIIIITFFVNLVFFVSAQETKMAFGQISANEMNYTQCALDTTAEAVVLSDKGESYFVQNNGSFEVVYERTTKIKILKQSGIDWANVSIPCYVSDNVLEDIYSVKAIAYNMENGVLNKSELDNKDCHVEKINENWKVMKFAIPNVKEGTVIEYKYSILSQYVFNLRDWEFQWKIPVLYSEYVVKMIPFYQYTFLLQGRNKFTSFTSKESEAIEQSYGAIKYKEMEHTYTIKDVPPFKDEEFIASSSDYIIKLDFQLSKIIYPGGTTKDIITTWPLLIKDLLEDDNFGKYIKKSQKMAAKVLNLESFVALTQMQKFDSIVNYVKRNYRWNQQNRLYASKAPAVLNKDKFGSSAELNLFTIGLLNAVGVPTKPVILSTRDHGLIKYNFPFVDSFNNVVILATVDSLSVLSDVTDELLTNDRLPVNCLNDKGLVIEKDNENWVNVQNRQVSVTRSTIAIKSTDSLYTANITLNSSEYDGLYLKRKFGDDKTTIKKHLIEEGYTVIDSSIIVKNMEDAKSPYALKYSVEGQVERINNKIYISPFLHEVLSDNPLKQKSRTYPIDMIYVSYKLYTSTIQVPEGYKCDFVPKNTRIKNDKFELEYKVSVFEDFVNITFYYYFKRPVYKADEYIDIKFYFDEVINKAAEKIVFQKK
jgi:hypothetical protein